MAWNKSNPDDRSDNVEKLQTMVQNTMTNIEEAEEAAACSNEEERQRIQQKNHNREVSIEAMRSEIKDESEARQNGYEGTI
ncbi:small acid-soluble spore protein Tlp [Priestia megaterium]|uniref:small acid-soluble spore protein Tlp n=1 Tax=Priestia megaterium TaxID=1404 RepID=UPI000CA0AA08|nr:small acid-soluble spore protein Tlp [Priestia megaterium]AUO14267.1 small acid-soluble spore protein Tlp [Priestia megaterium]PVE70189.1 small acid-soluble spore protein Tlp [Priestia megaterium]PVE82120.1 small acid-soluble spore protein Tlp [Priestia megaterium]PVE86707.1 small acid-soluble spore protein Tlp [Priestia megaterium]PVE98854.1 small acid-soluble spore protein Tlp [Priestia megaterium]